MLLSGSSYGQQQGKKACELFTQRALLQERRLKPPLDQVVACPRCQSLNTKFCYYNNYSLTQPRHFCKNCRRYWTAGGTLRNVPVGGGCRKNKRPKHQEQQHTDGALSPAAGHAGFAAGNNFLESCKSPAAAGLQQRNSPFASGSTTSSLFDNIDEPGTAAFEPFQHVIDMRDHSTDLSEHHPFAPAAHIISQSERMTSISNHSELTNSFESGIMNLGFFSSVLQPDHPISSMAAHSTQQAVSTGNDLSVLLDSSTYMNCNNRFGTFKSALNEEEQEADSTGLISGYKNKIPPAECNAQELKLAASSRNLQAPGVLQIPKQELPPWIQEEPQPDHTFKHEAGSLQDFNSRSWHAKALSKFLSPRTPPSVSVATGWSAGRPDHTVQPDSAAAWHEQQSAASHAESHTSHSYETVAPDTVSSCFWSCNPPSWSHLDNLYTLQGSAAAAAAPSAGT